ncbi:MAG TPA: NAD(P)/FAD-dependent oxidoreductase [Pyrinomonadaceae bacterium]|jgi:phytoene dehydrogenase-like protein|nr:NAD(P)/FAD-dependent oxidoreductase [Pyrinomonadaceae bacterium]
MKRPFRGLRDQRPSEAYDAVVVGAGVGGLVCANLLAREGLRVLLVEQHYMVGGYCSTFRRAGYTFDAATHFYPLLGNPRTITGGLLQDLGLKQRWVKMDPVDHFHFPDGTSFRVPADFDTYLARLKAEFPEEAGALDEFFSTVREVYMHGLLEYFRWRPTERLDPFRQTTVREALDRHFRSPKLKLMLTADCSHWGSKPSDTSFVFDSMLRLSYFLGNYYPEGGSQAFADELAQRFEERGGHILMSSNVRRVVVRGGEARGVEIETGPRWARRSVTVRAGVVVSNADLLLTLERMVGAEHFGASKLEAFKSLKPTRACFITHIGLKGMPTETLKEAEGYHWTSWDSDDVPTASLKIFVPTLFDPSLAPQGGHIVITQKLTEPEFDSVTDWAAHKAEAERRVLARLEEIIPGFNEKVSVVLSASALTSQRYTLNHRGAMLGWEMSPDQLGARRPALNGLVKNLYFVGHWTQPGGGITPVIVSAMRVAQTIAGRAGERPEQSDAALVVDAVSQHGASHVEA